VTAAAAEHSLHAVAQAPQGELQQPLQALVQAPQAESQQVV